MNINDYRKAMDHVIPERELKERIMEQKAPQRRYVPVCRVLTGALAAVLALTCLFTAALAANPELRTAVLSFFHMEEREQVPGGSQSGGQTGPGISKADIGQMVKARYIRMEGHDYRYSGGLLSDLTWSEDWKTLLNAEFWEIKDSEIVPAQVDMSTGQVDVIFKGVHYQGEFYWFVREGELCFFSGDNRGYDEALDMETGWNLSSIPGRTDAVLLSLSTGRQMDYSEYPMLYHLDTGAAEDILAGTGAAELEYSYGYSWSEDMRRSIILTGNRLDDQRSWFCDLDAGTLVMLDDLAGMDVYTAAFADRDTLLLHNAARNEDGTLRDVEVYAYDIPSGRVTKTLERTPYYRSWDEDPSGVEISESHCVLIDQGGQVWAIDLKTGARTLLEGFTFRQSDRLMFSPSGSRLLYFAMDSEAEGLGIAQLGVADLEKGVFFAFDREGYEDLREESIGWEDDHTVCVGAASSDGGARYIILYQF